MSGWRLAKSLETFRAEVKQLYPKRDTRSDGSIGDANHTSKSKHSPGEDGVVEAVDVDEDIDGVDGDGGADDRELWSLAVHLVKLGKAGKHPALGAGAHVIYEGRIWSHARSWTERAYTGQNAHRHHLHLAVADGPGKDSTASWGLAALKPAARKPDRWLGLSNPPMTGNDVRDVHNALIKVSPDNRGKLSSDYDLKRYGRSTADVIALYQANRKINERGVGPKTWAYLRKDVHG